MTGKRTEKNLEGLKKANSAVVISSIVVVSLIMGVLALILLSQIGCVVVYHSYDDIMEQARSNGINRVFRTHVDGEYLFVVLAYGTGRSEESARDTAVNVGTALLRERGAIGRARVLQRGRTANYLLHRHYSVPDDFYGGGRNWSSECLMAAY